MSPRSDTSMSPVEAQAFLDEQMTAVLASNARDGFPHLVAMWFLPARDHVRMWTYGKSQKAANLARDPRASFMVEAGEAYDSLRGVLAKGTVEVLNDFDSIAAIGRGLYERYTRPTTGIAVEDGPVIEIERQARKRVGLVLPFEELVSWDHSKLTGS